jgi:hypothetical protein
MRSRPDSTERWRSTAVYDLRFTIAHHGLISLYCLSNFVGRFV